MTSAISFSRQNDTGSGAHALCLLEKLVVVLVLESKGLYRLAGLLLADADYTKRQKQPHFDFGELQLYFIILRKENFSSEGYITITFVFSHCELRLPVVIRIYFFQRASDCTMPTRT